MMKKIFLTMVLLPTTLFAGQQSLYCATQNPGYVYFGDSIDQAIKICGKPNSQTIKTVYPVKTQKITEWIYNRQPNSGVTQGILKTKYKALIIDFNENNSIIKIIVEGVSITQTNYCNTQVSLKIGDTMQKTYQLCQWANNKKNIIRTTLLPSKVQTTLTYQIAPSMPSTKLVFEKSKLVSIN